MRWSHGWGTIVVTRSSCRVDDLRLHLTQQVAAPAARPARLVRHSRQRNVPAVHRVEQAVTNRVDTKGDRSAEPTMRKVRMRAGRGLLERVEIRLGKGSLLVVVEQIGKRSQPSVLDLRMGVEP